MRIFCSICADNIDEDLCATRCAHTFHFDCLNQWLLHSKTCPQCRESCRPKDVLKLFVTSNELTQGNDLQCTDPKDMQEKLLLQRKQIVDKDDALKEAGSLLESIQQEMIALQSQYDKVYRKLKEEESSNSLLRRNLKTQKRELQETRSFKREAERLKIKVETFEKVETLLKGKKDEVQELLHGSSISQLTALTVALKTDYDTLKEKRANIQRENERLTRALSHTKKELKDKEAELKRYQDDLLFVEEERESLQKKVKMLQEAIDSPGSRHTLKRMLESPMPELSVAKSSDVGASPLLASEPPRLELGPRPSGKHGIARIKRIHGSKENVVMPLPKIKKFGLPMSTKFLTSQTFKLKFAPRQTFLSKK